MDTTKCKVLQQWTNRNLAVCEPSASSSSSACLSLMGVWILHSANLGTCSSHRLTASLFSPHRLDPRLRESTTNALFRISLCSIFVPPPLPPHPSFPSLLCPFALRLERIRCSQKTKLGTSRFKCCLGWFLFTSMVRGFRLTSFLCVLLLLSCNSVRNGACWKCFIY